MKQIPDDIQPMKNEWLSAAKMKQVFCFDGATFSTWFESVKDRLKSVKTPSKTSRHGDFTTRYLVKSVWAAACAHGHTLQLTETATPQRELASLRYQFLIQEMQTKAHIRALEESMNADKATYKLDAAISRRLLLSTEPRPIQGVYMLVNGTNVVYVGQSVNVLSRMVGHQDKEFDSVRMIPTLDDQDRISLESRLIKMFRPMYNVQGMAA